MTIPDLFDRSVRAHPRAISLSHWTPRAERRVSTEELVTRVSRLAAGLQALGVRKGDRVLIISENRPEWVIADYATQFAGGILVPVYVSLTGPQLRYILENSGATVAIASTQALLDKLLEAATGVRSLRQVLVIDESAAAPDVMHLESVSTMGDDLIARSPEAWRAPAGRIRPDDVATIIYTSGTTGTPKGVMVSHGNVVSNVTKLCEALEFTSSDVALSFLPLCHITQRLADYCYFSRGAQIVHVGLEDISAALATVRPTTFAGVPRIYEKAREGILARAGAAPAPMRALFRWALGVGREMAVCRVEGRRPTAWTRLRHAVADRLVLAKVRRGMGGRLRYVVCGGAPLNPEVMMFFLSAGVPVLEGYGLTETAVLTINRLDRLRPGSVGLPVAGVELRVEDDGEILARGPGVTRGYYLDVQKTDESFRDGWFRTGDLGRIDADGSLSITGRKKELLVTSGGKKVSPGPIEQSLLATGLVAQVVLVGDGRKHLSALLVPDRAHLLERLRAQGNLPDEVTFERLLAQPPARALYQDLITEVNRGLARFEQIKKFALLASEFTQEGGELTPTLKIRRSIVEQKHRHLIDSLYSEPVEA